MSDKRLEYLAYAVEILSRRANDPDRTPEQRVAYWAAIDMIAYAMNEDFEALHQFDY